ncbi:MAG: DUF5666 domain-containing protein [Candidatus Acidiferrum sp.]
MRILYLMVIITATIALGAGAQEPAPPTGDVPQQRQGGGRGQGENGPRPVMGKITSITNGTLLISKQDGQTVTVKLTDQTQFRKDGNQATAADFKVGDTVMVRGELNADQSISARLIGTRTGGPGGRPGGGPGGWQAGTLGKDYVSGEIKSINEAKLTILRTDNVTQTIELNEETSLRKGRESVTMADVHPGDHVMARGALQNDVFVPKTVMVMNEEQWKRMQEMAAQSGTPKPPVSDVPAQATPVKPQE